MTDEIRQKSLWNMMFADDIVICSKNGVRSVKSDLRRKGTSDREREGL